MPWRCCQWHQQGCTGSLSQEIAELKPCVKEILTKGDPGFSSISNPDLPVKPQAFAGIVQHGEVII